MAATADLDAAVLALATSTGEAGEGGGGAGGGASAEELLGPIVKSLFETGQQLVARRGSAGPGA